MIKKFKALYFQDDVHDRLLQRFSNQTKKSAIIKLPTGAGKTFVATRFIAERYLKNKSKILWVAHRWTHINHFLKTLSDLKENDPGLDFDVILIGEEDKILKDELKFDLKNVDSKSNYQKKTVRAAIYVSSIQTLKNRLDRIPADLSLAVFDEDHWGKDKDMKNLIVENLYSASILGLTATPKISKRSTPDEVIGHEYSYLKLASQGYLAKAISTSIKTGRTYSIDSKGKNKRQINNLIRTKSLNDHYRLEAVANYYVRNIDVLGKSFIFCPNISDAQTLTYILGEKIKALDQNIINDSIVSEKYEPEEYNNELKKFKEHNGPGILTSVGILSDGVDIPDLKSVLILHKTGSDIKFAQMFGRGTRTNDGKKMTFNLVDFEDNIEDESIARILTQNDDKYYSNDFDPDRPQKSTDNILISGYDFSDRSEIELWRNTFKDAVWDFLSSKKPDTDFLMSEISNPLSEVMGTFLFAKLNPEVFSRDIREIFSLRYFDMGWEDYEVLVSLLNQQELSSYAYIKETLKQDLLQFSILKVNRINLNKMIDTCFSNIRLLAYGKLILGLSESFKEESCEDNCEDNSSEALMEQMFKSCWSQLEYEHNYQSLRSITRKILDSNSFEARFYIIDPCVEIVAENDPILSREEIAEVVSSHLILRFKDEWREMSLFSGENASANIRLSYRRTLEKAIFDSKFRNALFGDMNELKKAS